MRDSGLNHSGGDSFGKNGFNDGSNKPDIGKKKITILNIVLDKPYSTVPRNRPGFTGGFTFPAKALKEVGH
jgi:hypothetical protein